MNEIKAGMIVRYATEWCEPSERDCLMVVMEAYPDVRRCLVQHLNSGMAIGPTETLMFDMLEPTGKSVGEVGYTHIIEMTESIYDQICAALTHYEEGNDEAVYDMYNALVTVQRLYGEGEQK